MKRHPAVLLSVSLAGVALAAALVGGLAGSWRSDFARPAGIPFPADNAFSEEKRRLGEMLFYETALSGPQTVACATCHQADVGWSDHRPLAKGVGEAPLALRSPTLINVAWTQPLGWDGKFASLEQVVFAPISSPNNMHGSEGLIVERLSTRPEYREAFSAAFGDDAVTRPRLEAALATFMRTIVAGQSPFDRYVAGDVTAIGDDAKHGFELFRGKALCATCHSGWSFTDGSFHDIGTGSGADIGRGRLFRSSDKLQYAFKTPTLRDVAERAPYMHDGSVPTLEAVIDHYDRGGVDRPSRAEHIRPLHLTPRERSDLVAFLKTLSATRPATVAAR